MRLRTLALQTLGFAAMVFFFGSVIPTLSTYIG
jgi:hypothetical protein